MTLRPIASIIHDIWKLDGHISHLKAGYIPYIGEDLRDADRFSVWKELDIILPNRILKLGSIRNM